MKSKLHILIFIIFLKLFFAVCAISASNINIRIYSDNYINSVKILRNSGKYSVLHNNNELLSLDSIQVLEFKTENDKIKLLCDDREIGIFDSLRLQGKSFVNSLKININNNSNARVYDDNLILKPKKNYLVLINNIDIEKYISGVVEAESGGNTFSIEFFKMQAIICRTYALKNMRKHSKEAYNLCDMEHCQVYKGKARVNDIFIAVSNTNNQVIINSNNEIINAAFHANCGGETVNSEDVWSNALPYLRSVHDTFCLKKNKAKWEKSIPLNEFKDYFLSKCKYDSIEKIFVDSMLVFRQDKRKVFFYDTLHLKQLRKDFNLRSTFFSIVLEGDSVKFVGRGNGHGAGLCQEGAIAMAELGKTCEQIIKFYYTNVEIVDYHQSKDYLFPYKKK
ncbi:MAG: SpoIID/LytB domain-containing protein [Bacteroidales bacterium]|nr:SpoIID/LytB domain-containing protein [Bacteroidales bacterium]